jgi:hypothetical protein
VGSWAVGVVDARGGMMTATNGKWTATGASAVTGATSAAAAVAAASATSAVSAVARRWAYGDVIGVCVDVEDGKVTVVVNGVVEPTLTMPLTGFNGTNGWLFPALSLHSDFTGVVSFGGSTPLLHPLPGYDAIALAP